MGSPHNSVRLHSSVWTKSPPLRLGSPDSSKQRLQGLCSTTGTSLPPTERSNRGSTTVGRRTRVLQPLLPRSKERRRFEAYSGSTAFEFFPLQREVQDADDKTHHVSGPGGGLVCHHRPKGMRIFTSRSFKDTGGSFGLPLEGRLTNTRSCPSAWLATSKQRISHWVRDAISLAYEARKLPSPFSLRAHSTRGVASSQALFRGVPLEDICVAAGWSSPHTFVKFYNLDVDTAPGSQVLSV